jgi:hypothetical protein
MKQMSSKMPDDSEEKYRWPLSEYEQLMALKVDDSEEFKHTVGNQRKINYAMASNLCLRGLVIFSRGFLTFEMLDLMILVMNSRHFMVLLKAPWVLPKYLFHLCTFTRNPTV